MPTITPKLGRILQQRRRKGCKNLFRFYGQARAKQVSRKMIAGMEKNKRKYQKYTHGEVFQEKNIPKEMYTHSRKTHNRWVI